MDTPITIPILIYIISAYVCRGYTNLVDYCFEIMVYCFIADEEMFQGTQRFADSKLRAFFDTFGQEVSRQPTIVGGEKRVQECHQARELRHRAKEEKKEKKGKGKSQEKEER